MPNRLLILPLALVLAAACVPVGARSAPTPAASTLAAGLDSIFSDTAFAHAHWGVLVRSLATGATLYERDAGKAFVPASAMKVVTGAVALAALGAEHRFRTTLSASGPVSAGTLRGDLVVRGSGDPTISARFSPDDARAVFRAWGDSLRARGITRVAGGIVGVDSAFSGPSVGPGWAWDDLPESYGAEVGALQFNEGMAVLQVVPSRTVGAEAVVIVEPATQYVRIDNRVVTGPPGTPHAVEVARDPASPLITLTGSVPAGATNLRGREVAVRDPTDYFLAVMRETLREAGVAVEGQALAVDEWPEARSPAGDRLLFAHASPPLGEVLPAMLKPSQNQIAESLLRAVGRERRGEGSAEAGVAVVDSVLRAWSVPTDGMRMVDGAGLSGYDQLAPATLVGILNRMRSTPDWELWYASLPSAGQSGTLANRMRESPLRGRVHAKTGTLTGVRSLAGYLETDAGELVVFSIVVNNHARTAAAVDRVVERALERVAAGR